MLNFARRAPISSLEKSCIQVLGTEIAARMPRIETTISASINSSISRQETQDAVTSVSGLLKEARDLAERTGIPHIVYFQDEGACNGAPRGPYARVVRDNDFSYSQTPGDQTRTFTLPTDKCDVTPYGKPGTTPPFANMALPTEDGSLAAAGLVAAAGPAPAIPAPVGLAVPGLPALDASGAMTNGTTFSVDATSGLPAVAFNERGIPVNPATPTDWATGAGGVYITNNNGSVYVAVVSTLGDVKVRSFNPSQGDWH